MGGYYAFGKELCNGNSVFDFDTTKLSVHTLDIGLAGIEVYDILRDEYDIQIGSATLATFWPTFPSVTARRRLSALSAHWPRSSAATAPTAPAC